MRGSLRKLRVPLNYRQEALIQKAVREPHTTFTIASHQRSHRIAYGTARSDLLYLETQGFLESQKQGKTHYFYPVTDLAEKMKGKSL